ncbi:MAG: hypothetical protein QNJ75_06395 [Acidimicrobiia bacterium]|nr:hypothetical protein [Acidimicrobiia bacterium]
MDENTTTELSEGFFPVVQAEGDIAMREGGSLAMVAGGNLDIREGGAGFVVAGGDVNLSYGGAGTLIAGGGAELSEATVGQMVTVEANVAGGRVGLLVAGRANLEQSEILITVQQAAVLGAVAGLVLFLLSKLFGRN